VNGYAEWGEKLLDKVSGMFAFFIFDSKENSFFAARDPIGVKPLYWAQDENKNYYFASEIKSLAFLRQIETINLFPPAHFMIGEKLKKYFSLPSKINHNITEEEATEKIGELFDHSIKIRVQTDLPVAVYLSGGIDSTAVLATAIKYHNNVTAIIVGSEKSTDRITAVKYCEENNIKYVVKTPPNEEELAENIKDVVKATESFEPNMIRQSAVSYHIAKTAAENNFKVILCGEGADEIFAGYPEFTTLNTPEEIEKKIIDFLSDLHRTQLQRVDRTSMAFTTEVREPFLDKELLKFVLQLPAELKIKRNGEKVITKYILRKAMSDRLPEYIFNRDKVVLSEGAGYKGNQKIGGLFYDIVSKRISDEELNKFKQNYSDWNLETKEDVYYFKFYLEFGYQKAIFNKQRTIVNKTDTQQEDTKLAKEIFESFDTWKFKREQPKTPEKIMENILQNIRTKKPITFVMYWGRGEKDVAGSEEIEAIKYLDEMLSKIRQKYLPGVEITFIFTDTHAKLNGYSESENDKYFDSVKKLAKKFEIKFLYLGELAKYNEDDLVSKIDTTEINPELFETLKNSSQKHCKKMKDHTVSVKLYFLQNQIEKKEIEKKFASSIFLTYNGSNLNDILPTGLPIFYMYSIEKGTSIKPWFEN
jgi:asparagine synthase (glutamine-hydrolysing)